MKDVGAATLAGLRLAPVPPEYPAARTLAEPGEVMYPGLGAMDWRHTWRRSTSRTATREAMASRDLAAAARD